MQSPQLDRERLRRLAELRSSQGSVLSLYLNLDPSQLPTGKDRSSAVRSLIDDARRKVQEAAEGLSHGAGIALRRDLERATDYLGSQRSWARGARGLALFSADGGDVFEVVKLPRPVEQRAVVDQDPWIEPLAQQLPGPVILAVLVDRRRVRFLHGPLDGLAPVAGIEDEVHRRHDQGGWSQARYQRNVEKEVHDHLRHAARLTSAARRRPGFERLAIGATSELAPAFEAELPNEVRRVLLGRFDVDVESAKPADVVRAVRPLVESEQHRRAAEAVEQLAARDGDGRAASGLADVLAALVERRVETLLYAEGFSAPGSSCPRCGWLGPPTETCPVDGTPTDPREDVVDEAIEAAVAQDADVVALTEPELRGYGPIGAVLRF